MITLPEITLAILSMILLVVGAIFGDRVARHIGVLAIGGLLLTGGLLICPERLHFNHDGLLPTFAFGKMFVDDGLARFMKVLILFASALSIMLSWSYMEQEKLERFEYPILILFATVGMMLMVSANNLLALYVGLELQSLALYVLAAFARDQVKSSEAGLKYFVLGALSSGLLLYGISLIYGYAGSTDFVSLSFALREMVPPPIGIIIGMVFICSALAFKVSAVPFHMWTPDVYEGAPTPVTAFFASAPKLAGLALLTRLLLEPLNGMIHQWDQVIVFAAVASMALGSFAGLVQTNIKRLMAYSSIANIGYALVGIAVVNVAGIQALLIFLAIYYLNTLGVFSVILCLRRRGKMLEKITDLAGLGKSNPLLALTMVIFMFSMAGVPPLAGFFGKYFIFLSAVKAHMVPLAIVGMLTSVVAAFYYLRIIKIMYFDEPLEALDPLPDYGVKIVLAITSLFMIVFTIFPNLLIKDALIATRSFIGG